MVFSHHLLNVYAVMSHAAQSLTLRLLVDLLPLFLISEWVFKVLWVKSASIQVQRGHWKRRSCSKDGLLLFTSSTCHEGILKAESADFPYLKCLLTLMTTSKRDLYRVYLAWNKWWEMLGPSGSLPCQQFAILMKEAAAAADEDVALINRDAHQNLHLHTQFEGLKWEIRFHHWYWSRSTWSA